MKFKIFTLLFFYIIVFENCSTVRRSNKFFPFDDTIPRNPQPKPEAVFYKGNFFQYFPAPVKK